MDADELISRCLSEIRKSASSPFDRPPTSGYLRGIDVYSPSSFMAVLKSCFERFRNFHGYPPNFAAPIGLDEKIFRAKFFSEYKVPESGNKLQTSQFIPASLQAHLRCPRIAWHSHEPRLPRNDDLPPGRYFLKASHGSGMVRPLRYPLDHDEREQLESLCRVWLNTRYGVRNGEWWYGVFRAEVILEEQISGDVDTVSWNVLTFRGRVGGIAAYKKFEQDGKVRERSLRFDADFQVLSEQHPSRPRLEETLISEEAKRRVVGLASQVGAPFPFVRVDLLLDENEDVFLGELTFAPNDGLNRRSREHDAYLGSLWQM